MKKAFLIFSLVACFLPLSVILRADTVVEEIIARVNNQIVSRSEYLRSREQLKQELQQQDAAQADKVFTVKQKDVLRDLIDQQLLLDKGKDLGITADTELVKRLDEMRKQMNLDSMEDLEKAATSQGISYEDFKQNLRNQIITQQVIGKEVGSHMSITKEEEQKFYEEHKNEMQQPEQIKLSEILVSTQKPNPAADQKAANSAPASSTPASSTPASSTPATSTPATSTPATSTPATEDPQQLAAAEAKAQDLLAQIRKGASFEEIAKKNSDGPSAPQGGDLGLFKRGMLAKELEDKTFAMKPGEVTDVIRAKQGFVILKVSEHQQAGVPSLKEMEPRIQDAIYMQKLQPSLRAYLTKLREEAFIDVKPGYVDTGASANQTKPVETTTKEANARKLKKKKKFGII